MKASLSASAIDVGIGTAALPHNTTPRQRIRPRFIIVIILTLLCISITSIYCTFLQQRSVLDTANINNIRDLGNDDVQIGEDLLPKENDAIGGVLDDMKDEGGNEKNNGQDKDNYTKDTKSNGTQQDDEIDSSNNENDGNKNEVLPSNNVVETKKEDVEESNKQKNPFDYFTFDEMEKPANERNDFMKPDDSVDLSPYINYDFPSDPTREDDKDCIFLNSSIYRSVYVYPTWMNETDGWHGPILNNNNKNLTEWPWIDIDKRGREGKWGHYGAAGNQMGQYTLELIVRDLMTHPDSCLRTMDPTKASLFYVPYLPSTEFHDGKLFARDYSTSPYAKAIESAIEGKYDEWEHYFGLTSDFWKRRSGADHILVFSEPLHGLSHPRNKRGSHHFIHTQKMLTSPIILSIEVSTSFVKMYPKCSAKNIVTPYPNPDGDWLNGQFDEQSFQLWEGLLKYNATLPAEMESLPSLKNLRDIFVARPVSQYYSAGRHGTCAELRINMGVDYDCTASSRALNDNTKLPYHLGMRVSTFCPCPGGDSPSAKRMFDAVNAGCIPVILSYDYVWPFTVEADPAIPVDPASFALRWNTSDFWKVKHEKGCKLIDENAKPPFQGAIESIDANEIGRLREGMKEASDLYSYWSKESYGGSDHPLRDGVLPNGGAARAVVKLLGERAGGSKWAECAEELQGREEDKDPRRFYC